MRKSTLLNRDWWFERGAYNSESPKNIVESSSRVALPHTVEELPFNYFDEAIYQNDYTYQRLIRQDELTDLLGSRRAIIQFEGVMAYCQVFLNGQCLAEHKGGYTPFDVDLTDALIQGKDNVLTVAVDCREREDIPPFGGQIDYLTYGGIYRDVHLLIVEALSVERIKVDTQNVLSDQKNVSVQCFFRAKGNHAGSATISASIENAQGDTIAVEELKVDSTDVATVSFSGLKNISLWSVDAPVLYRLCITLVSENGVDDYQTKFGFRSAEFKTEGFFLNGELFKIRGINRHQSWPYLGYAVGNRAQKKDADLVKKTLGFNLVRTSHYPQSKAFIDYCDEIGLLVFEEIPGWQHLGGDAWQDQVCQDVQDMIERDWNSPSIILWGVRINESADNHDLYTRTNALAHRLDPSRQTGGVRCIENSELLEDVYTMNDFIHCGDNELLRDQKLITGLEVDVPYLVTEYNGHMFPTKRFDQEERQHEHVMRHLKILDRMYGASTISGSIAWSMFDYNTHKDFGSGDRICYHGVTDMFRIEKHAAYVYASQLSAAEKPVLHAVTVWSRGERSIGGAVPLVVLTNCDYIEFQYGDEPSRRVYPDRETFPHMPNAPIVLDERNMAPAELGEWGLAWSDVKLTGYLNDKKVISKTLAANSQPAELRVTADDQQFSSEEKELTRVVIEGIDQCGNVMPYWNPVITLSISGPGRIVGPPMVTLSGGATATYIESTLSAGRIELTAKTGEFSAIVSVDVVTPKNQ